MLDPKKIEEMARQIGAAIPPKFREVADDVEAKVKAVLQAKLSQLDFVSREEFDVQRQVLLLCGLGHLLHCTARFGLHCRQAQTINAKACINLIQLQPQQRADKGG